MNWLEAAILGLVQGLTEFLPVSSSAHLVITQKLFGLGTENIAFDIVVHAATVLSVIVVFRKQIAALVKGLFKFEYNEETKYILMICLSMIPVMVVGLFFKDRVEALFGSGLLTVGIALLVTALLLLLSESVKKSEKPLGYGSAFLMGMAQAVAVVPGLSRSGSTIATGLLAGVKRETVTQFSFLMVLVPILGETFLEMVGGGLSAEASGIDAIVLVVGFATAFLSGLFACRIMLAIVRKAKLKWFALYCAIVGLACLASYIL